MDLTERKKQILKRVVEDYIAAAEPVGSKALAEEMGGSVSSATIRNELADLVEMGYLEQPHTSAGRVPSPKGYRLYVNELMEKREVSETEAEEINEQLKSKLSGTDSVIAKAGQMVSSIVNYPVYSVTGGRREASVKRFELIAVDEMSFIVVVMGEDNRVKSQLQRSDLPFDSQRLADVKELLNTHFTGRSADEMSARLMSLSEQLSPELFLVVSKAVEYAIGVLEQSAQRNVETAGASQILKMPEYRDVDKAHDLVTFLVDNKEELPVPDDGAPLKILIGPENVNEALKETSVVATARTSTARSLHSRKRRWKHWGLICPIWTSPSAAETTARSPLMPPAGRCCLKSPNVMGWIWRKKRNTATANIWKSRISSLPNRRSSLPPSRTGWTN